MGAHGDLRPKFFQTPDHKFLTHRVLKKKSPYVLHIIVINVFVAFVVFVIVVTTMWVGGQPALCSPRLKIIGPTAVIIVICRVIIIVFVLASSSS